MIELPVTLSDNGAAMLPGYAYALALGYAHSNGVYALRITPQGVWQGLTVRAVWHPAAGEPPPGTLVVDGRCDVPAAITAQSGSGCVTFEGTDGAGITVTSADLPYRVAANSGTDDGTMPEPGTPAWEAFVAEAFKAGLPMATQEEVTAMFNEIFKEEN